MKKLPKRTATEMYWGGILSLEWLASYGAFSRPVLLKSTGGGFVNVGIVGFLVGHIVCSLE